MIISKSPLKRLTAVLPLKIRSRQETSDLDRFCLLLLPSFEKFWEDKDLLEFLIIVPPSDISSVKNRIKKINSFPINIVTEDELYPSLLCPSLKEKPGWYKQQILKLMSANVVQTECFLTLDSDIILIKPVTYKDLFPDNKPIFQQENASVHWNWWLACKSVLKSNLSFEENTVMMGVTPEILYKDICINLLKEVASRNSISDPAEFLLSITQSLQWTEHQLYWLYAMEKKLTHERYSWTDVILYEGVWINEDFGGSKLKAIKSIFYHSSALFLVLQSTLQLEPKSIAPLIFSSFNLSAVFKFYFYSFFSYLKTLLIRILRRLKKLWFK